MNIPISHQFCSSSQIINTIISIVLLSFYIDSLNMFTEHVLEMFVLLVVDFKLNILILALPYKSTEK